MSELLEQDFDLDQPKLHLAIAHGDLNLLSELLQDIDILQQKSLYGYTPLETAARHGNIDILSLLIDRGADVNFQGVSSPLHEAVFYDHVDEAKFLIDRGANVNARISDNQTPLMISKNVLIIRMLIEFNADVNAIDCNGYSAGLKAILRNNDEIYNEIYLHMSSDQQKICEIEKLVQAIRLGKISLVENAVKAGCDVNLRDREGWTLLMNCAMYNQVQITHFLLDQGANASLETESGDSALIIAEEEDNISIVKLIKNHLAKSISQN